MRIHCATGGTGATGRATSPLATAPVLVLGVPTAGLDGPRLTELGLAADAGAALTRYVANSELTRLARPGSLERLALVGAAPRLVLLVGLGDLSRGDLRSGGAALARSWANDPVERLTMVVPPLTTVATAALVEGLLLGGYHFQHFQHFQHLQVGVDSSPEVAITIHGGDADGLSLGEASGVAAMWARDLANTRSSTKTPVWLAEQARATLVPRGLTVVERDVEWLREHHFGAILAVGAGMAAPPRLIEAAWNPRDARAGIHVVLVGKSITYDSGGLNIKPLDSMTSMYTDMSGGAAVLGALRLIAERQVPIRVTGLLPAAENAVSGSAMRQGDVIRHYGGRTSEVNNTDAEGRLVLADAMAYAVARLKPTVLVDLATLTGAMKVALGLRTGGLFASDDKLAGELLAAAERAGEPLWRLPLADDYLSTLHSDIADATNSAGNPGGISAALFLRPFAADVPWAHLDIAGPARASEDAGELSRGATGYGARLLGEWLINQAA